MDDDVRTPAANEGFLGEFSIYDDGLYLKLEGEVVRLDSPNGLPADIGDRTGVVGVALCELAIQRLIRSDCMCPTAKSS